MPWNMWKNKNKMKRDKKTLIYMIATVLFLHSLIVPPALPGFLLCLGVDGHVAIEREYSAEHFHADTKFHFNQATLSENQEGEFHNESCLDISLDRDNDYKTNSNKIVLYPETESYCPFIINDKINNDEISTSFLAWLPVTSILTHLQITVLLI